MKSAAIPAVRVPPGLRRATEELLAAGETLFDFVARGLASRDEARASGGHVTAASVLGKLDRRLEGARKKAGGYVKVLALRPQREDDYQ